MLYFSEINSHVNNEMWLDIFSDEQEKNVGPEQNQINSPKLISSHETKELH